MNGTLPLSPRAPASRYCLVVLPAGHAFHLDNGKEYIIGRAYEPRALKEGDILVIGNLRCQLLAPSQENNLPN